MQRAHKQQTQTAVERITPQPVSLFENCKNSKKQGDLGEACAIFEYAKRGYVVCYPLCDSTKYDLIVEKNGVMMRVQVKTSSSLTPSGGFMVSLATTGGNMTRLIDTPRLPEDYDELFVLTSNGRRWMIPAPDMGKIKYNLIVGKTKWGDFEIS